MIQPEQNNKFSNMTILVVDDDDISSITIQKVLEKSGYQIITADSGEKAIEICIEKLPDLILLDVVMPGLNGYETCTALRNIADYNSLPILILTGLDDIDAIDKAFQSGATDFITKPLNWPLLSQRVKYALRTRELFNELSTSERKLAKAQNIAKIGYWEFFPKSQTIKLSTEAAYILGVSSKEFHLDNFLKKMNQSEALQFRSNIDKTLSKGTPYTFDHSFLTENDIEIILNQHAELFKNKESQILVGTFQDISERIEAEKQIYLHRYYDIDTGLPNKEHLRLQINKVIDDNEYSYISGVLSIAFDKLRSIGSSVGGEFISLFLKSSAQRIINNITQIEEVSRISSTSLGLVINNLQNIEQLEIICGLLIQLFKQPIKINDQNYHTTLSIGVTVYPIESNINNLLNNSNTAQKNCITEGGSKYLFYNKKMDHLANKYILLEDKMRKALESNEFHAYFQPQINSDSGKITGMEALARWIETDGNIIYPDTFIPLAEETEIIIELGKTILFQACEFAQKLKQNNLDPIRVGVNLSAMQFSDRFLLTKIKNALQTTGLEPDLLEIEITESIAMTDINHAINTLSSIRDMGIKTSMDDFGTGYSSLSYLQKLPLDTLKIDQSFIRPIGVNGENSEIARAIIAMGHSLNMHLIAEGAEEAHHYQFLKELGCHEIQGYYFSKPLSQQDFTTFTKNYAINHTA